jgi:hypothetical protein
MKHSDVKMDKAVVKKAVHKHEKAMHPGKPMTKLAKGGKTNLQMRQLGRNLAKVANQKSSSFTYKKSSEG